MYCNRCGRMNDPGNRFCMNCGAPIVPEAPSGQPARGVTPPPYPPYYGQPFASNQQPPKRKKKSVAAILLGILSVLLATIIVLMATGVTNAIFSPQPTPSTERDEAVSMKSPPPSAAVVTTAPTAAPTTQPVTGSKVINIYSFTEEVPRMVQKYIDAHPDFGYTLNPTVVSTTDNLYEPALDEALTYGGQVDIYCVESAFVQKYTQGDASVFAMPYADLGIDVTGEIMKAQIAQYSIDIGTRTKDNALVALGYQATGGAFIYRRSIAKKIWGTDDSAVISNKIGPGWDQFISAAADLKKKGYCIVSGSGDIWQSVKGSADKGWVIDKKLFLDPKREAFLDYSKTLSDKGYTNGTQQWMQEWFNDMVDAGPKPVFGFFGPSWMVNYVLATNSGSTSGDWAVCIPPTGFFWGGTWILANNELDKDPAKKAAVAKIIDWITLDSSQSGLQYAWASGTLNGSGGTKDTVASRTVMSEVSGDLDFLGGQNMNDVFIAANQMARGDNITQYDSEIDTIWQDEVRQYVAGSITREQAIISFKQAVKDQLGFDAWE